MTPPTPPSGKHPGPVPADNAGGAPDDITAPAANGSRADGPARAEREVDSSPRGFRDPAPPSSRDGFGAPVPQPGRALDAGIPSSRGRRHVGGAASEPAPPSQHRVSRPSLPGDAEPEEIQLSSRRDAYVRRRSEGRLSLAGQIGGEGRVSSPPESRAQGGGTSSPGTISRPPTPASGTGRRTAIVVALMLAAPALMLVVLMRLMPSWHPWDAAPPPPPSASAPRPVASAVLHGSVVDSDGEAVDGARVVVVGRGPNFAPIREVHTDAFGQFSFADLPAGRVLVVADHPHAGDVASAELSVAPDRPRAEPLILALVPARDVHGHVVDEDGIPVAQAQVAVEGVPWLGRYATGGEDGAFTMERVPSDATRLLATANGFLPARLALAPHTDDPSDRVVVTLRRAPDITGTVVTPDGAPSHASVSLCDGTRGRVEVDDKGSFSVPASAEGCAAVAQSDDYGPSDPVVVRAGERLTLRLAAGGSVSGVVVERGGAPVVEFQVGIESFTPQSGERSFSVRSGASKPFRDPDGAFTLDRLAPGSYVLTATADGKPPARSASIDVVAGKATGGIRITLAAGGTVEGRVFDSDSRAPLLSATVSFDSLTSTRPDVGGRVGSDETGRYRLDGAPGGPFTLRIERSGYRTKLVSGLRVDSGGTLVEDVALVASADENAMEFDGVGAGLAQTRDGIIFSAVFPNDPAQNAGAQVGDRLRRINGESVEGMSVADAIQRLRGDPATPVTVSVEREGVVNPIDLLIARRMIVR